MTDATDQMVQASVNAFEYTESAWRADDHGAGPPDPSGLSDQALLAVMHYAPSDLPRGASDAVESEASRRGLIESLTDRWVPWVVSVLLLAAGVVILLELLL